MKRKKVFLTTEVLFNVKSQSSKAPERDHWNIGGGGGEKGRLVGPDFVRKRQTRFVCQEILTGAGLGRMKKKRQWQHRRAQTWWSREKERYIKNRLKKTGREGI